MTLKQKRSETTQPNRTIMWALTYRCNLSCKYCFLESRDASFSKLQKEASQNEIDKIIESLTCAKNWKPEIMWITGGEPTLYSKFDYIIDELEKSDIKTVLTTNGVLSQGKIDRICDAHPRGITISLDCKEKVENDKYREAYEIVINSIKEIANKKKPYTKLGVATTLTTQNIGRLKDFAYFLKELGVDYLSINPLHAWQEATSELDFEIKYKSGTELQKTLQEIKAENVIELPCSLYLQLLINFFLDIKPQKIICPASTNYCFISPWGYVYPCSHEFWHSDPIFQNDPVKINGNWDQILAKVKNNIHHKTFDNYSNCFNLRCLCCIKVYYDDVFLVAG